MLLNCGVGENSWEFLGLQFSSVQISSVQFSSVAQSCLTLCGMPGFPVHHQLPEPAQTHVHWVGDAIQPSHPLSSPYPPAFNLSQHQDWQVWSPCNPRDSQASSLKPQFKSINSLALSFLYGPNFTSIHDYWKNHSFDSTDLCQESMSLLFKMLARFFIAFLPRSKHLLIS